MARFWFLLAVIIFIAPVYSEGPPKVTGNYKASGDMAETLEDETKMLIQVAFEESYNSETQDAAFRVWELGKKVTFVENYATNQTFRYDENGCQLMTVGEWIKTDFPPSLLSLESTNGVVRFSLKQLFSLDSKYLKEENVADTYRGIPARKWMYEIKGVEPSRPNTQRVLSIYAYWSETSWNTSSNLESVPLGFIVSKMQLVRNKPGVKLHEQFINVFGFVPDAIDHSLFEPVQGAVCEKKKQTIPFPNINNIRAISMHSEVIFPDYQEIKYMDTWFDPLNKMLRMDMERIKDENPMERKTPKYESIMVLGKSEIVMAMTYFKEKVNCEFTAIKDYSMDLQDLVNYKAKEWSIGKLFGVNETSYTYIGETIKRDIPCHLFQGIRKDWPNAETNVESLWEWCFSTNVILKEKPVIFLNGEYGLVNVQITILKSDSPGDFPPKFRIFHHFYDVNLIQPSLTDASNFDIGYCFEENEKRRLQFTVDWAVTYDSIDAIENATSDVSFLSKWKEELYKNSDLDPNYLRISGVRSTVIDNQLLVKFTILSPHKSLPIEKRSKQISAFDAERNLRNQLVKRALSINYTPSKGQKAVRIGVIPHSLKFQINTTFQPHILPPTTSQPETTTSKIIFSLITEPDKEITTPGHSTPKDVTGTLPTGKPTGKPPLPPTDPTLPLKDKNQMPLHNAGTVATVSIAMLLIGITIGATGIFVKQYGLPPCLKCNSAT